MLRSSTQLVKSHSDDLGLEYLWNGDEYGSLENSLKVKEKKAEFGGQPKILAPVHVMQLSIFAMTIPPPAHPRGFALKTLPHSGAFAS